jgi:xylulokinase
MYRPAAEIGLLEHPSAGARLCRLGFLCRRQTNGDLLIKLGGLGISLFSGYVDDNKSLYLDFHVIPDLYLINGCMASSGSIIKWFRDQFGSGNDYSQLDAEAWDIPAGSNGLILLPYFLGEKTPLFDPHARGVLFVPAHTLPLATLQGICLVFHHVRVLEKPV